MDINKILSDLGLDFSDPETKRGAMEAIDAILSSREPPMSMPGGGGGGETEVELDPDLLQPSVKHQGNGSDDDIEIEDEEDILSQVKTNDSEDEVEGNSSGNGADGADGDSSNDDSSDSEASSKSDNQDKDDSDSDDEFEDSEDSYDDTSDDDNKADDKSSSEVDNEDDGGDDEDDSDDTETDGSEGDFDDEADDNVSTDDYDDDFSDEETDPEIEDANGLYDLEDGEDETDESEEDEEDFDENDLLDDTYDDEFEDKEIKTKNDARKIKRERTIAAGKKALEDAKAKNVSPAKIKELEQAIAALEELTEAIKNIKDISDDEFNQMINRVFDAIDGVGDTSLTYSSDEDRQLRAKEIKADIASTDTQVELSAEDAAKIRADHQTVKAREKETAKYQTRSRGSFKGFQDFLNSLYKAVALQVDTEETRNDSWSAINRRYGDMGVLKQGQKIQELPNKKIPVIDFYFDQSGSWGENDIKVGKKAVAALADLEAEGKIKINIYYFANYVSAQEGDYLGSGTGGWNEIVKNVLTTNATNVIIMTDDDMENWWTPQDREPLRHTVPGYVWYLWRDGLNAPRLPRDLKGRGGTQQFSFSAGDI